MIAEAIAIGVAGAGGFSLVYRFVSEGVGQIADYAYMNTKISAYETRLLNPAKIRQIAEKKDVRDAIAVLSGTDYSFAGEYTELGRHRMFVANYMETVSGLRKDAPAQAWFVFEFFRRELEAYNIANAASCAINGIRMRREQIDERFFDVEGFGPDSVEKAMASGDAAKISGMLQGSFFKAAFDDYIGSIEENGFAGLYNRLSSANLTDFYRLGAERKKMVPGKADIVIALAGLKKRVRDGGLRGVFGRLRGRGDHDEHALRLKKLRNADREMIRVFSGLRADEMNVTSAFVSIVSACSGDGSGNAGSGPGFGLFLDDGLRGRIFSVRSLDELKALLKDTPYGKAVEDGIAAYMKTKRVSDFARKIDECTSEIFKEVVRGQMFSCGALIGFVAAKKKEMLALEAAFMGIEEGVAVEFSDRMEFEVEEL